MRRSTTIIAAVLSLFVLSAIGILAVRPGNSLLTVDNQNSTIPVAAPVRLETVTPVRHCFSEPITGEGHFEAQVVRVPSLAKSTVTAVYVAEGDTVSAGQLLAEFDDTFARLETESAALEISTAVANWKRIAIGSSHRLTQERPEEGQLEAWAADLQLQSLQQQNQLFQSLQSEGFLPVRKQLEMDRQMIEQRRRKQQADLDREVATRGVEQSLHVAENDIRQAVQRYQEAKAFQNAHQIYSPTNGTVQEVNLVVGEHNFKTGGTAITLHHGLWFAANIDQRSVDRIQVGQPSHVILDAYIGQPLAAEVIDVDSLVAVNAGGPDSSHPVRSNGMQGPEWPVTFKVRMEVEPHDNLKFVPGMSGYALLPTRRERWAIPLDAVTVLSRTRAEVWIHDYAAPNGMRKQTVYLGAIDGDLVEVRQGIKPTDQVIRNSRFTN